MEQDIFLCDHGDLSAQRAELCFPDVETVDANRARRDVVKTRKQIDERRLARAARADEGDDFALAGSELNIPQNGGRVVGETDAVILDLAGKGGKLNRGGSVLVFLGEIEVGKDLGSGALRLLKLLVDRANTLDRFIGLEKRVNEGDEHSRGH